MFLSPTIVLNKFKSSSMMLRIILFFLIYLICFTSNAQVGNAQNEKRNEYLKELSQQHIWLKNAKSIDEELKALLELNYFNYQLGNRDSSYYYGSLAYNLIPKTKNKRLILVAYNNFGRDNFDNGKFSQAINIYKEAFNHFLKVNDSGLIVGFLHQIAVTYNNARDYKNQLVYERKSIDFAKKFKFPVYYATIGDAYLNMNQLDSALYFFNKDYELVIKNPKYNTSFVLFNLGEVNFKLNNIEIALSYYKKGLNSYYTELSKGKINDNMFFPEICIGFSEIYNKMGKYDSAIFYARKSYNFAKEINLKSEVRNSSENLYKLYASRKMYDSAYTYQSIFNEVNDSLYSSEKVRRLEFESIQEQIKEAEIQEEVEKANQEREKNLILGAIGFFIPVFFSMVFLVSKWKKNTKLSTSLGIASLLMLFEFISLLVHPFIEKITHHNVILMYIILLIIASALVPLHHRMEKFVKERFSSN
jgi:hypothetical protein